MKALLVKEDGQIYLIPDCPVEPGLNGPFITPEHYREQLTSAKQSAILVSDHEQAYEILIKNNFMGKTNGLYESTPGIYPIPGLKWEIRCKSPLELQSCTPTHGQYKAVAVLLPEQKDEPKTNEQHLDGILNALDKLDKALTANGYTEQKKDIDVTQLKSAEEILKRYETYVKHSYVPVFLEKNVLAAMEEYASQFKSQAPVEPEQKPIEVHATDDGKLYIKLADLFAQKRVQDVILKAATYTPKESKKKELINELAQLVMKLSGDPVILSVVNSINDTLPDDKVIDMMKDLNDGIDPLTQLPIRNPSTSKESDNKVKAEKWDALAVELDKLYKDSDADMTEVGETASIAFGYL